MNKLFAGFGKAVLEVSTVYKTVVSVAGLNLPDIPSFLADLVLPAKKHLVTDHVHNLANQ